MAYVFGSIWDRKNRNALNELSKIVNYQGKSIQELVAEGQLTPTQYATLIQSVNGLISKGDVSVYDINKNLGKFDQTYMADDFLQQIAGTASVNAVPADGSITSIKLADKAVNESKTSFFTRTRNIYISGWEKGGISSSNGGKTAGDFIRSIDYSDIKAETTYTISDDLNYNYVIYFYDNKYEYLSYAAISGSFTTPTDASKFLIRTQNTTMVDTNVKLQIEEGTEKTQYAPPYEFNNQYVSIDRESIKKGSVSFEELDSNIADYLPYTSLVNANVDFTNGEILGPTPYRLASEKFIDFPAGSTVKLLDTGTYGMIVFVEGESTYVSGAWDLTEYESTKNERIRLCFRRDDNAAINPNDVIGKYDIITPYKLAQYRNVSQQQQSGQIIKYVSLTGSDGNTGNNIGDAYATLQKALDDSPNKILIERGIYYGQSATKNNIKELTILPFDSEDYDSTPQQPIEFRGSDLLNDWTAYNAIYTTTYSGNSRFNDVFVNKTLNPVRGDSYNAPLWEGNNKESDYLMKPVMTLAECEAEVGTFFYDGSDIYINPQDINNEFNAVRLDNGIKLSGDTVTLQDFRAEFCRYSPLDLDNIKNLKAKNCEANHSYMSDGFSLDYTNGTLENCKAYKNINDGFNIHFYGDTTFINCYGVNNYDDGISHHEHCTGTIIGGVWKGNSKAGIAPVNHAQINTYNALIEGNAYGIYNIGIDNTITNISQGNFFKDNGNRFRNSNAELLSINDTSLGNGSDTGQTPVVEY